MALQMRLVSAVALVTGEVKEKHRYIGQGDKQQNAGRKTDHEGRPLSSVSAVGFADPGGGGGEAKGLLPDMQLVGVAAGAAIRLEGELLLRLSGRDFSAIAAEGTAERMTPVGPGVDWATAAAGKKSVEARAS